MKVNSIDKCYTEFARFCFKLYTVFSSLINGKYQTLGEYIKFSQYETYQDLNSIIKNLVSFKILMEDSGVLENVLKLALQGKGGGWFAVLTAIHSADTPTMANFKLPKRHQQTSLQNSRKYKNLLPWASTSWLQHTTVSIAMFKIFFNWSSKKNFFLN